MNKNIKETIEYILTGDALCSKQGALKVVDYIESLEQRILKLENPHIKYLTAEEANARYGEGFNEV